MLNSTIAHATVYARRHKRKSALLCGSKQRGLYWCDGVLGELRPWRAPILPPETNVALVQNAGYRTSTRQFEEPDGSTFLAHYADSSYLAFPEGWSLQDRVWGLSKHARERIEHGHAPGYRQYRGVFTATREPRFLTPDEYPCRARCPKCQLVQVLDRKTLDVMLWPYDPQLPIVPVSPDLPLHRDDLATPVMCLDILGEDILAKVLDLAGYSLADADNVRSFRDALILVSAGLLLWDVKDARRWHQLAVWAETAHERDCHRVLRQIDEQVLYRHSKQRQFLKPFIRNRTR